jgi:hypothetical protein
MQDPFNLIDIKKKATGKDGQQVQTGFLVVREPMTELEFEAYAVELNALSKSRTMPDIIFEDEDGNVQTSSPRDKTP